MKKWIKIIFSITVIFGMNLHSVSGATYNIKDEFTFSSQHSFAIEKNDDKAEKKLRELKSVFDEVEGVEIKLEKTGSEGLDIFMAYYSGEQAEALDELYWNFSDPFYENYWNDLVEELKVVSKRIRQDVGLYYGIGMAINISGEDELLLIVTDDKVMVDNVNAINYDPDYINLFN